MYVCEFEFVRDGDLVLCWPFWPGRVDGTQGEGFERINLACPREVLHEALLRFEAAATSIR